MLALAVVVIGIGAVILGPARVLAIRMLGLPQRVERPVERARVSHELYMKVYKELGRAGIEIPFPQRDVWMRRTDPVPAGGDEPRAD